MRLGFRGRVLLIGDDWRCRNVRYTTDDLCLCDAYSFLSNIYTKQICTYVLRFSARLRDESVSGNDMYINMTSIPSLPSGSSS